MRIAPAVALCLSLAACASAPPLPPKASLAFESASRLVVPAAKIEIVDNYKPPLVAPNVEHQHDVRPASLVQRWIAARTKTIPNAPGALTLTVKEASVIEQPLEVKTDWRHMFDRQSDRKLTATLAWRLAYESPSLSWQSDGSATSVQGVLEQSSLNEADADYNRMIESLAAAFDQRLAQQLGELGDALANIPVPAQK